MPGPPHKKYRLFVGHTPWITKFFVRAKIPVCKIMIIKPQIIIL